MARQLRDLKRRNPAAARLLSKRIRAARVEMVASAEREVVLACRAVVAGNLHRIAN